MSFKPGERSAALHGVGKLKNLSHFFSDLITIQWILFAKIGFWKAPVRN